MPRAVADNIVRQNKSLGSQAQIDQLYAQVEQLWEKVREEHIHPKYLRKDGQTPLTVAIGLDDYNRFLVVNKKGYIKYRSSEQLLGDLGDFDENHTHDGATLQLDAINSDGGIFLFNTSGTVRYNQRIRSDQLSASRILATNADKELASVADLRSWILQTANQVLVTNLGNGTVRLSAPQDIHTGATPTFAGLIITTTQLRDNGGELEGKDSGGSYRRLVPAFCQLTVATDQAVSGSTVIDFATEDRIDSEHFSHPANHQIKVLKAGWYRITVKMNADDPHRTQVLKNGVELENGTCYTNDSN